jgi:hypothetical protein
MNTFDIRKWKKRMLLIESATSDQAKKLGLEYFGFGRYGKKGKQTHIVKNDKLVKVPPTSVTANKKDVASGSKMFQKPLATKTSRGEYDPINADGAKSQISNTKFSADSDNWYDDTVEWTIDPQKWRGEYEALDRLKKLVKVAPTKSTIQAIYNTANAVERPHLKRIASQAAKILNNKYKNEFKNQFGLGVSQASEFLSHLRQALTYND